jgi:hypothetical protein
MFMQIKSADGRNGDVLALEQLLDRSDVPTATRRRIESEIAQIRSGEKAERDASYDIELYFGRSENWATIHDLRFEVDGLVAQIDHLVINRLAQIWVCESKAFAEGVSVNEHGEWSRWWNGHQTGIPSPIEQNHRHIHLLERVFEDGLVRRPRRLGLVPMNPDIKSLVLVSNNARISRPRRTVKGMDEVIKAEQLKTRLFDAFDREPEWKLATVIGKKGLAAFARELAALHRPVAFDWPTRFGLGPEAAGQATTPPSTSRDELGPARMRQHAGASTCERCGREVSATVVRYCLAHSAEFGGHVYCMRCQPEVRARAERPLIVPPWLTVLERYRTPTRLRTVARQAPFIVVASGADLRVSPDSTARYRTLTRADFERAAPLLGHHGRAEVNEASRNSSYVEAILADFRRS